MARPCHNKSAALKPGLSRAFSIVELMAVVVILLLLMSILVTVISRSKKSALMTQGRAQLAAIGQALDAYAHDFKGMYPMSRNANGQAVVGEHLLAKALIGPGPRQGVPPAVPPRPLIEDGFGDYDDPRRPDGSPMPKDLENPDYRAYLEREAIRNVGFRTVSGGAPHNGYLVGETFKAKLVRTPLDWQWEIMDPFGNPIAYLPRRNSSNRAGTLFFTKGNEIGIFDPGDMAGLTDRVGSIDNRWDSGQKRIGKCVEVTLGDDNGNGRLDAGESLRHSGAFVLISAGPEGEFWSDLPTVKKKSDNIYNFDR